MAAWLKKERHGRRADRIAHADHVLFRRLLQAQPPQPPQPPMAGTPASAPLLLNTGPVNALSITYRVNSIAQPVRAQAHVCPLVLSLACFLASWQAAVLCRNGASAGTSCTVKKADFLGVTPNQVLAGAGGHCREAGLFHSVRAGRAANAADGLPDRQHPAHKVLPAARNARGGRARSGACGWGCSRRAHAGAK